MVRPTVGEYPALVTYPTQPSSTKTGSLPSATAAGSSKTMLRRTLLRCGGVLQRRLADEVVLVHLDREIHARGGGLVFGGHVGAPQPVGLFDAQAVERDPACGDHAVGPARFGQQIPQRGAVFGARVDLPAQLADIGHPQHGDRDRAEVGLQRAEVLERLVRQVVGAQRLPPCRGPAVPTRRYSRCRR